METLCLFVALFSVTLTELNADVIPSKQNAFVPQSVTGGQGRSQDPRDTAVEDREKITSVTVSCHPDYLDVVIQADLFGVGVSVKPGDLRLGVDKDERCRAVSVSKDEYRISCGLLDCGTKHWMIEESLVYTNLLIYSPEQSTGVVRMEEAVIPIECHYRRKYSLTSSALQPKWIPFVSTRLTMEKISFSLKIMSSDWLYRRGSNVFYLGDAINIEASVKPGQHVGLRVFLSSCVATLTPDEHSSPRYVFIEDGCLRDSQVPNSRSQFLSRTQDDKLKLVIDAFRFHNENRGELYISCQMRAVPINDANSRDKACTYIDGRWRSADGNEYLCGYCQSQKEEGHIQDRQSNQFSPRGFGRANLGTFWKTGLKPQETEKEASVGPLIVFPVKSIDPEQKRRYGSIWRSGTVPNTVDEGLVSEILPISEDTKNFDEMEEGLSPDATSVDDADLDDEASDEDAENGEVMSEIMEEPSNIKHNEVSANETTPMPSDFSTTLLPDVELTTSLNDTDSAFPITKEPKK